MHPILFTIGDFTIWSYGPVYLLSFLAAVGVWALLTAQRTGLRFVQVFETGFQVAISGEVGARITFLIVEWDRVVAGAISLKQFLFAGRVVLGGVVAGALAAVFLFRKHRLPVLATMDAAGVGVSLGMAIGRFGCLLSGCCYGKPTDLAWGITFTDPVASQLNGTTLGTPLHPTQPLQMATGFLVFGTLLWLYRRKHVDGQVFAVFFMLAGVLRLVMEFLRGDERGVVLGLATSQWIGIGMTLAAGAMWLALRRRAAGGGQAGPTATRPAASVHAERS